MKKMIPFGLTLFLGVAYSPKLWAQSHLSSVQKASDQTQFLKQVITWDSSPTCNSVVAHLQIEHHRGIKLDTPAMKKASRSPYDLIVDVSFVDNDDEGRDTRYEMTYHPERNGNNFTDCREK